jgi:Tfp pilus assembly protein PilN
MRAINLLPRDAGARKSIRSEDPAVVVGSAVGLVVILALALGFMNVHSKVGHEQSKLDAARQQLAQLSLHRQTLPKPTKPVKTVPIVPVPAVTADEQPRLDAIKSALSQRIDWDRILREFSLVLPNDISITSLQLGGPTTPAPGATTAQGTLTIDGSAYSHDGVARFLSRLMLVPDLTGVTLQNSSADTTGVTFSINAAIKGAATPPPTDTAAIPTTPTDTTATTTTSDGSSS